MVLLLGDPNMSVHLSNATTCLGGSVQNRKCDVHFCVWEINVVCIAHNLVIQLIIISDGDM